MSITRNSPTLVAALFLTMALPCAAFVPVYRVDFGPGIWIETNYDLPGATGRLKRFSEGALRKRIKELKLAIVDCIRIPDEDCKIQKLKMLAAHITLRERAPIAPAEDQEILSLMIAQPSIVLNADIDIPYFRSVIDQMSKRLGEAASTVSDKTGLVLGLLEADPPIDVRTIAVPGKTSLSRAFKPLSPEFAVNSEVVYAIRLRIDGKLRPPDGTTFLMTSAEVQPIFMEGSPQKATWNIDFSAERNFGEVTFPLKAELLKFANKTDWQNQRNPEEKGIDVPIPKPSVKPDLVAPLTVQIWVPIATALIGLIGGVLGALITRGSRNSKRDSEDQSLVKGPDQSRKAEPGADTPIADNNCDKNLKPSAPRE